MDLVGKYATFKHSKLADPWDGERVRIEQALPSGMYRVRAVRSSKFGETLALRGELRDIGEEE
jgi:hypothetical protein